MKSLKKRKNKDGKEMVKNYLFKLDIAYSSK
jgi:hypothetical protein